MRQKVDNNKHAFHVYVQPISVIIWEDLERTNVNSVNAIIIHLPAILRAGLLAFSLSKLHLCYPIENCHFYSTIAWWFFKFQN